MNIYFKETKFGHFCLLEKDLISNWINSVGYWEQHLYYFYSQFIRPDDIVIDGGANIGFHSIQFAKLARRGKVYSFEPQLLIFNILSTNILINGASEIIEQYRLALGDKVEKLRMSPIENQIYSDDCVNYGGRSLINSEEGEEASLITIDSLDLPKLDFIKLDIQGFEWEAIRGGEKTIKNNLPIFFLENYIDQEKDQKVLELLREWGYTTYRLDNGQKEDCILVCPSKHKIEIEFIENQNKISFEHEN
jgi:FkbM family methyltransferase